MDMKDAVDPNVTPPRNSFVHSLLLSLSLSLSVTEKDINNTKASRVPTEEWINHRGNYYSIPLVGYSLQAPLVVAVVMVVVLAVVAVAV